MPRMLDDNLGVAVLAAGALGTAAFGIVEGLKSSKLIGEAGFSTIVQMLRTLWDALRVAYGSDVGHLLRAQYRGDSRELARVMRQGVRLGLTPGNAAMIATELGVVTPEGLADAARAVEAGLELTPQQRNVLGRFELAVDARIESALTLALDRYKRAVIIAASVVSVAIALVIGRELGVPPRESLIVGIAAVPLAPVAKDVASALKAAATALSVRA